MKNRIKSKIIIIALLIATTLSLDASATKEEVKNMKKIVGYFPNWGVYGLHRQYSVDKIPWDKLTHVNIAFAQTKENTFEIFSPDIWADFGMPFGESYDSQYKGNFGQFKKLRGAHPHVSVLISIGGWTLSGQFAKAASTAANRERFAKNAVAFMQEHEFDGIDIDWEFPTKVRPPDKVDNINDQGTLDETEASKENFTLLLKALREELDKAGTADGKYYQLTAAIGSSEALIKKTEPKKYSQYLDFINIMSYDMHGAWENRTNHQSPLFANPNLPNDGINVSHAAFILADDYNISRNKIVIGSPFYTRGWKNVKCDPSLVIKNKDDSPLPGLYCSSTGGANGVWDGGRAAGVNPWFNVVNKKLKDSTFTVYRDEYSKVPYLYSATKKEFYTYEDEISVKAKADFVKKEGFGGIIFWELSADTRSDLGEGKSLLDVIYNDFYSSINKDIKDTVSDTSITQAEASTTYVARVEEKVKAVRAVAEGAASTAGIASFDTNHGPEGNPHYEKGEKVSSGNSICTAKWWTHTPPPDTSWDCVDTGKNQEEIKLANTDKEEIKSSVQAVASSPESDISSSILEIATEQAGSSDSTPLDTDDTKVSVAPLSTADIQALEEELNRCHNEKVYINGDMCQMGNKWYKFKWWTKFAGTVTSAMVEVDGTKIDTPKVEVVPASNLKKWSQNTIYPKEGIITVHDGFVYKTKYWTQGNQPEKYNSNSPWKLVGVADMTQAATDVGERVQTRAQVEQSTLAPYNPIVVADDPEGTTATYDPVEKKTVVTKSNPSKAKLSANTAGDKFFMPFVDVAMWPPYDYQEGIDNGIKNFALAFVNSAGTCSPTWGNFASYTIDNKTLNLPQKIRDITTQGGSVMISFGGATAGQYELPNVCTNVDDLARAYQEVIDKTGARMIDFDIEGVNAYNKVNVLRRMKALKKIQDNNPDVEISFTLATMPSGLVTQAGIMILKTAIQEGVKFKAVNLMLMDYGAAFPANGNNEMAAYSIMALQSVNKQLHVLLDSESRNDYPQVNGEFYNLLGAIPMIGRNDTLSEWFYRDDARMLREWCDNNGVRMTSMWSLNRDKAIENGESEGAMLYKSTKLNRAKYGSGKYEFSKLLKREGN